MKKCRGQRLEMDHHFKLSLWEDTALNHQGLLLPPVHACGWDGAVRVHQWSATVSTKVLALTSWVIWVFYSDLAPAWSCGSNPALSHLLPRGKRNLVP